MSYKIVFAGTGMIGSGLAANALLNDCAVTLFDVVEEEKIRANLKSVFDILVKAGATTQAKADEKMAAVNVATDLKEALKGGADMVQECVPERIELKKSTYRTIQEELGDKVLICSSTSAMMPSVLQEDALFPGRIVVGHPYNPSYLLPLIEICGGPHVSEETLEEAKAIYTAMGKVPVVCRKEQKGFIVNNMSWAVFYAGMDCVKNGICSAEDADKALMFGPGMRMAILGQLLTISLGIEGGLAAAPAKYGVPDDPMYALVGASVDEEMANRKPEQGRTVEEINEWRDKAFVDILKIHGML